MIINNQQFQFSGAAGNGLPAGSRNDMYSHTDALVNRGKKPRVSQSQNREEKKGLYAKYNLGALQGASVGVAAHQAAQLLMQKQGSASGLQTTYKSNRVSTSALFGGMGQKKQRNNSERRGPVTQSQFGFMSNQNITPNQPSFRNLSAAGMKQMPQPRAQRGGSSHANAKRPPMGVRASSKQNQNRDSSSIDNSGFGMCVMGLSGQGMSIQATSKNQNILGGANAKKPQNLPPLARNHLQKGGMVARGNMHAQNQQNFQNPYADQKGGPVGFSITGIGKNSQTAEAQTSFSLKSQESTNPSGESQGSLQQIASPNTQFGAMSPGTNSMFISAQGLSSKGQQSMNPLTNSAFGHNIVSHNNAASSKNNIALNFQDKDMDFATKIRMKSQALLQQKKMKNM